MIRILFSLLLLSPVLAFAQETVTIPKSRLEELERKEAELEKLKSSVAQPQPIIRNSSAKKQDETPGQIPPQPFVTPLAQPSSTTPSLTSLNPLAKETVVAATDLAAHYHANAAEADKRYRKRTFKVQGEIVSFEKPAMIRNYNILLKTGEAQTRIICDFYPPERFKAIYTINAGTALVGVLPGTRVPIAKIGDNVVIEGRCKGLSNGGVKLTDCELKATK